MSYHLTEQAQQRLQTAVTTASSPFGLPSPVVEAEVLDGPEGSALHVKVRVPRSMHEDQRRLLMRAIRSATLDVLPEIPSIPLVTLLGSGA